MVYLAHLQKHISIDQNVLSILLAIIIHEETNIEGNAPFAEALQRLCCLIRDGRHNYTYTPYLQLADAMPEPAQVKHLIDWLLQKFAAFDQEVPPDYIKQLPLGGWDPVGHWMVNDFVQPLEDLRQKLTS